MEKSRPAGKASSKEDGEAIVLAKIAAMAEAYRAICERLHMIILSAAPVLTPTTWYGMPAYAKKGKIICFFRADKYVTFGLSDNANLSLEPDAPDKLRSASWFLDSLDEPTEIRIAAIVRKAAI